MQLICLSHASVSRVKCPFLCGKANTCANIIFSCSVANASSSSCLRVLYPSKGISGRSNQGVSPFPSLLLRGAATWTKFRTNRWYTFHKPRDNFNSVTLHGSFKFRISSLVLSASSNLPCRITCPKKSMFSVKNLHLLRFNVTPTFCKGDNTVQRCDICSSLLWKI